MSEVMKGRRARAAMDEETHIDRAIKTIVLYILFANALFISIAFLAVV
ncbi:MAG: hypothetical protein PWP08_894 [Methanofollis sp.]|nr:hypothetical protein [Methanofollis sp.]